MDAMIGRTIGKYRIVEHLGRGGMAEVYKAYQPNLDRYVAIKMMHAFLADEKEFLTRFEREAKVVATLRHPNIVQVHDFDVEGGVSYMVMEFISGETLKSRIQDLEAHGQWVALDDAARVILSVGSALKYAHERGMVHRDVKPANVMITLDGQVILTDFGIAKIVSTSNLTASGAMVGTPSYMAPEQGMGQPGDERSDIYSLGVMLYQLVLGRLPYDADTPLAVVLKHINEPLPLPRALKPDISDDLNRVILKSLAKDPNDRYQKVADLSASLRQAMGMSPEDSQANAAKGAAIKLTGATLVGRVGGGITPLPTVTTAPKEQSGTQVSAPKTVVAGAAAAAPSTVVFTPSAAAPVVAPVAAPAGEKKRPGWLIPVLAVLGIALVAIIAMGVIAGMSGRGEVPSPTRTAAVANIQLTESAAAELTKEAVARTPTAAPLTTKLLGLEKETELRNKAGNDPTAQIEGLLPAGSRFFVKARTDDSKWVRIETFDGVTGWIDAAVTGLKPEELQELPAATTLTRLTEPPATPRQTPTPSPTPRTTVRAKDGMTMVYVPSGTFKMGSDNGDSDEKPVHSVTLDSFWIDRTEVTDAAFKKFVADTRYRTDAEKIGSGYVFDASKNTWNDTQGADWQHPRGPGSNLNGRDDHPVVLVSWNDANAYCQWTGGQLPTEAQWEYAARGPQNYTYPWGNTFQGTQLNFCDKNCSLTYADKTVDDGYADIAPVGSYPSGISWVDALDLAGNVWEWVHDWYGPYSAALQANPTGPNSGTYRVLRGGSWSAPGGDARTANRATGLPVNRRTNIGFRCVAAGPGE